MDANKPEPTPIPNEGRPIWELVIGDMVQRDNIGRMKYGTPLQAGNGRDALVDAYQEALDLSVYLRKEIEERAFVAFRLAAVLSAMARDGQGLTLDQERTIRRGLGLK